MKLPFCKEVYSPDGELAFRGPRLRMAIHFAVEGTVAHRYLSLHAYAFMQTHAELLPAVSSVAVMWCPNDVS